MPRLRFVPCLLLAAFPAAAQAPLRLAQALAQADGAAYANRLAAGAARERIASATAALQGLLPAVRIEGGVQRTDDPLGAFGAALQQRALSVASFDPVRLNAPAPVTAWSGALVAELPLLRLDAWSARGAATAGAAAADANRMWARENIRAEVIRAYYAIGLAHEEVRALEAGAASAAAARRQAEALQARGAATRSDALLANVEASRLDTRLAEARSATRLARERLALLLGDEPPEGWTVAGALPSAAALRRLADELGIADSTRADVVAGRFALAAAERDRARADAGTLPRIAAFAREDWHAADRPFGGRASLTVGIGATWSPLPNAALLADRAATRARVDMARANVEAAQAQARFERQVAEAALGNALAALTTAEDAVGQASEAYRIMARQYAEGLATILDLLQVGATETRTAVDLARARYAAISALVELRRATGGDLLILTRLEP